MSADAEVCAVVGGQFGSEGKGLIVSKIATEYGYHARVGAANAGHTLWTFGNSNPGGQMKHVMQQIPCAAYANPGATLCIGPGALISPHVFEPEWDRLVAWRRIEGLAEPQLIVDHRAHVITGYHIDREVASGLAGRIGSTSAVAREGIGAAQAARVMREEGCIRVGSGKWPVPMGVRVGDVPAHLRMAGRVLLEGTQGYGLSLTTGDFPYVTSRNTTAAGLCADCGVPSADRVILVARTYPIRVAGNSGDFHSGSKEIEWSSIGVSPELTTVTRKQRRIATFSLDQVIEAVHANGATEIALTFCDYLEPRIAGADSRKSGVWTSLGAYEELHSMVDRIERATGVPVTMLGTGPKSVVNVNRQDRPAFHLVNARNR